MLIADDLFAKAKALYAEANLPPGHPDLLKLNVAYADILYKMGEKRESIMVHDRALKACIALHGVFHQHTVLCYDNLINQSRSVFAFEPTLYYMKKKARILEVLNGRYHSENSLVYLEMALYIYSSLYGDDSFSAQNAQKALDEAKSSSGQ